LKEQSFAEQHMSRSPFQTGFQGTWGAGVGLRKALVHQKQQLAIMHMQNGATHFTEPGRVAAVGRHGEVGDGGGEGVSGWDEGEEGAGTEGVGGVRVEEGLLGMGEEEGGGGEGWEEVGVGEVAVLVKAGGGWGGGGLAA